MKKILICLINIYKKYFALGLTYLFGKGCRFQPSCSQYAREALEKYGVVKGGLLSVKRILRCHPFGNSGFDPIPKFV